MRRIALALTVVAVMTLVTGCGAAWLATGIVAGGAAMGLYTSGATEVVGWTIEEVKQVSLETLDEVGDEVIAEPEEDAASARYESRFEDGDTITIKLKALSESATRVRIWVAITGDRERSRLILDKIRARLRALRRAEPAAIPAP